MKPYDVDIANSKSAMHRFGEAIIIAGGRLSDTMVGKDHVLLRVFLPENKVEVFKGIAKPMRGPIESRAGGSWPAALEDGQSNREEIKSLKTKLADVEKNLRALVGAVTWFRMSTKKTDDSDLLWSVMHEIGKGDAAGVSENLNASLGKQLSDADAEIEKLRGEKETRNGRS